MFSHRWIWRVSPLHPYLMGLSFSVSIGVGELLERMYYTCYILLTPSRSGVVASVSGELKNWKLISGVSCDENYAGPSCFGAIYFCC